VVDIVELLVESARREIQQTPFVSAINLSTTSPGSGVSATARSSVISSDAELSICLRTAKPEPSRLGAAAHPEIAVALRVRHKRFTDPAVVKGHRAICLEHRTDRFIARTFRVGSGIGAHTTGISAG
jgi:hypothetical protein